MKTVTVLMQQSFLDLSIQYTGTVYNAFEIARVNNRSITDQMAAGDEIIIPDGLTQSPKALQYFEARKIVPATGLTGREGIPEPTGIGSMIVDTNFIIT
ncbi:hypothetical protein [Flavobacterium kingsejongi]|uniref:LysM domain-containing protein n=1 Tax=Flavobacterium kingsejongi TaxID=1678728 RepID=A0A2S1LM90_9FLAO|nr:hypothetical protein [Flavobacterium kingsejongi]AWG24829.1 hypothetical protein FK004_06090 [Flavobacterium kingsejongi]